MTVNGSTLSWSAVISPSAAHAEPPEKLKARLEPAGVTTQCDREVEDAVRFFAEDPWGNRLEFVAMKNSRAPAAR